MWGEDLKQTVLKIHGNVIVVDIKIMVSAADKIIKYGS